MKNVLALIFVFIIISPSTAQFRAINISAHTQSYLDDNRDDEYTYTNYMLNSLVSFRLGYSFPISENILLTPRLGVGIANQYYGNNTFSTLPNVPGEIKATNAIKENRLVTLEPGIQGSYWFNSKFRGLFFTGELYAHLPISARSEVFVQEFDVAEDKFIATRDETISIKDQFQSVVPIASIGVGYDVRIAKVDVFAALHLLYRPTGFYKDTENISHISRSLELGLKYVFGLEKE